MPTRSGVRPTRAALAHPPGARAGLRSAIWLYRRGFGWLLGDRFLLLTHRDRWSREKQATVLDVVEADSREGRYVVATAAGDQPGWLLDVARDPRVHVNVGADSFAAVAASLVWSDTATLVELYRVSGATGAHAVRAESPRPRRAPNTRGR